MTQHRPAPPRWPVRLVAAASAVAGIALLAGIAFAPRPPSLSTITQGDNALITAVQQQLDGEPGAFDRISVAVIDSDTVQRAHFGASDDTLYEIGSVTKTMTASLLQIAVERGEVQLDTRLGEVFDLGDSPAADITLEELATHHSGLPRLSPSIGSFVSIIIANLRASDPYGSSVEELVSEARRAPVGEKSFAYSNFGYALLGQALAKAAGTDWPTLVNERVHTPLQMKDTTAAVTAAELPDGAPTGFTESGRPSAPWTLGAEAPAGNVRSTLADMTRYLSAQLDGTAPGVAATEPIFELAGRDGERIGLGWLITKAEVTWHNGATGGFSSFVAFDRELGKGVIVLSSTVNPDAVEKLGLNLLKGQ